jgi:drug/metabolite transporter (DMT)-like permease
MSYLLPVSIVWGFSFVIMSMLVSLDSNFVAFVRMLISFVFFLPCLRPSGIPLPDKLRLMSIGGVQFGLMYVALVASYQYIPAHTIALLTATTPLFVTMIGGLYDKKIHKLVLFAALLAVVGGAVIKLPEKPLSVTLRGVLLLQMSNAAFAFGQIAYRRLMSSRGIVQDRKIFGFMYGGGVLVTGAFALATVDFARLSVQPRQWMALLYLGAIASGLCFFLWNLGARKVNEGTLAVMNNFKIPIGVIASLAILKEHTHYPRLLIGCALFAAALWINGRVKSSASSLGG